ncbi:MAG: hypothetical protein Q4G21_08385 [Dermabacter sp.]|nr:hypothetical protein [Dermabacter sp.]
MSPRYRTPFALGAIAFAIVFLLIVGVTSAVLVVRGLNSTDEPTALPTITETPSPTAAPTTSEPTPTPATTASVAASYCYTHIRSSPRPSASIAADGRLVGGGISVPIPEVYATDDTTVNHFLRFTDDDVYATALAEEKWVSTLAVGAVTWEKGVPYPGDQAAATRIFDCMLSNTAMWEPQAAGRRLDDKKVEAVTIDGMSGYKVTGSLFFTQTLLKETTHDLLTVVVLTTPDGRSAVFSSVVAGNNEAQVQGAAEALAGLTAGPDK